MTRPTPVADKAEQDTQAGLAPCPFCGSPAEGENTVTEYSCRCTGCNVSLRRRHHPHEDGPAEAEAISAWNRRAALPGTVQPVAVEVKGWRCFHCDEVFTEEHFAREHFGRDERCEPACQIAMGAERSLLSALRRAEDDCNEMTQRMQTETTDSAKAYYAQTSRHQQQLRTIEELGYERGLRDAALAAAALAGTTQESA